MKLILTALFWLISLSAFAEYDKGLGLMIGNPTGLNGKMWLENGHAIDGGAGFTFGKQTNFSVHSDYLLQKDGAFFFNDVHPLDLYYGIGGRMEFADDINLGVRVPVGLVQRSEDKSSDIFGEIAPIFDFIGRTGVELHILIGSRYYF